MIEYILASASPRRRQLLGRIGLDFTVAVPGCDESGVSPLPEVAVKELSLRKAKATELSQGQIVIAADTVVALDGQVLGKPEDEDDAKRMLRALSGKKHFVYTGVTVGALREGVAEYVTEVCETAVFFRELSENEICEYVSGGSPMDKAGAYGIQDAFGSTAVSRIEGDYYNVVGLPLCMLREILNKVEEWF